MRGSRGFIGGKSMMSGIRPIGPKSILAGTGIRMSTVRQILDQGEAQKEKEQEQRCGKVDAE